jgi:hypothetical protein
MRLKRIAPILLTCLGLTLCFRVGFNLGQHDPARLDIVPTVIDPLPLLRDIANRHQHGTRDDALTYEQAEALTRALEMTCGPISDYALRRLSEAGIVARRVGLLTLEAWDGETDGHQMLEVWYPAWASWVVVDFTTNRLYPQTVASFVRDRLPHLTLADDPLNLEDVEAFYDRVAQVAVIWRDGRLWHGDYEHRAHIAEYGYLYLSSFLETFYT